jgi:sugar lactone lactonase YvrE
MPGYSGDGGPATQAQIGTPSGLAIDSKGNLYIGDTTNFRIRQVDTSGIIRTIAGVGTAIYNGDGLPALKTAMVPLSLAVSPSGVLYYTDSNLVRRIQ